MILVDASAYIYRAFYTMPPIVHSDGTPTGAVRGYCHMLLTLMERQDDATHLAVVFDKSRKSFRHEIYPEYKATRKETPSELAPQFKLVREATEAFGLPIVEAVDFEADDLIASYATAANAQDIDVEIVSSDKDLMQLIGERIWLWCPLKRMLYGPDEVKAKFGVYPDRMIDFQALMGDATDNVPGIPGCGPKTAVSLLSTFGTFDRIVSEAHAIKPKKVREFLIDPAGKKLAQVSRDLVTLKRDVPLPVPFDDLRRVTPDKPRLLEFAQRMEFVTLADRIEGRAGEPPMQTYPSPEVVSS
jgi:DNA polymerase-1